MEVQLRLVGRAFADEQIDALRARHQLLRPSRVTGEENRPSPDIEAIPETSEARAAALPPILPLVTATPRYPIQAIRQAKQGRVVTCFLVNSAGLIVEPEIIELSDEIFREPSLVALYRSRWSEVADFRVVTEQELVRAGESAAKVFALVSRRENPEFASTADASLRVRRAWTLVDRAYDQCRRALQYLRHDQGDADVISYTRRAEASALKAAVTPFGNGSAYARFLYFSKVAPNIVSILANSDGILAEPFRELSARPETKGGAR